jgi:LacI family transcriptional regulator
MTTIKDVAKRAKVSAGTVSNVISGTVAVSPRLRKRVLEAVRELDFHPNQLAKSLKKRQTEMLGMIISDIANPFFPLAVRGAEDAAWREDYLLITFNTDDDVKRERQILSKLRARRVDGVLLVVAPTDGDISHIERTVASGIPIVCLDRIPDGISLDSVSVDSTVGTRECIRHLVTMGHRDIAIINGPPSLETARARLRGYEEALREAGIPVDPRWIRTGDFRIESGYREARELLRAPNRPTALFVANGMMTLGALNAMDEMGVKCPEDIALASYDDLPLAASFRPRLTAVAQDAYKIGQIGAELLIQRVKGLIADPKPIETRLRPELKIRESTLSYRHASALSQR